ncbi:uncharacterized protein UMAG_04892 [Mycosarcoma maydis]|uniref:Uncharacterized protein n=1 Tax=Mycosarcoma maydis TaxID=5270 RepID=A0A0D1DRQ4_MYCMD|nr:uncharacterized protein UMAG_04892 [Ustilago maydis 521]KIS67019.1 hypothetical protein UMAG_04892 [Ustilago maydis 521]|eukprot:XP_011391218.1 hypothetical protein UMAG_04892 [Ustilago maydis 521]
MSAHTPTATDSQSWLSQSDLLHLLSTMTPNIEASPLVASTSSLPMHLAENSFDTIAPSIASDTSTPSGDNDILSQYWHPCTQEETIGGCLNAFQFPASYRDLVYRWEEAGSPPLRSLRVPLGLRIEASAPLANSHEIPDLHTITELQERAVIGATEDYFRQGCMPRRSQLFVDFASYLDIYTSLHVELMAMKEEWTVQQQASAYQTTWRRLLDAFDSDRSKCTLREPHECLHHLLWGEVSAWPVAEIIRCFKAYKMQSPSTRSHLSTSAPTSPLFNGHSRSAFVQAWAEGIDMSPTPPLSSCSSTSSTSSKRIKAFGLSPVMHQSSSTHSSPVNIPPTSAPCRAISPPSTLPDVKPWPESTTILQSLQDVTVGPSCLAGLQQATYRRHSRSSSYPESTQLWQLQSGFPSSQSDGLLTTPAAGSPQSDDASLLLTRYPGDLQTLHNQLPTADAIDKGHHQSLPAALVRQHHSLLLQDAAVQLDMAAQLLSAKASRLRNCSTDQEQWHSFQGETLYSPAMRRPHAVHSAI